jgi:uncharacterized membrane protein
VVALLGVAAFLLPLLVTLAFPARVVAQTKVYHMDRYDSNITVNKDGSLDIQETLTYVFTSGTFRRGLRTWDTDKLDSISNIKVAENRNGIFIDYRQTGFDSDDSTSGVTGTYGVENDGNTLRLRWIYGSTSNTSRTFRITYHVSGAIRVYDDHDEFDWYAVPPDWGSAIFNSRVQATFPTGSDSSTWEVSSIPSEAELSRQGNTIVWTAGGGLGGGFEVGAKIPKGVLSATKPAWQAAVDQQEQQQQNYDKNIRPIINFALFLAGILILVGGILLLIMRWYRLGRDKPVKLPTDYLTEPPSDLPPGLVGTLLDESADVRDVIATVVDMGKKGNLTITENQAGGLFGGKDFQYTQTGSKTTYPFEDMVLSAVFKSGQTVGLSDLKNQFYSSLSGIYDAMYKALVDLKYFPENPINVRSRSQSLGCGILVLGIIVTILWFTFGSTISYMLLLPGLALGAVGVVGFMLSGAMPRKTDFGAEEAEKWRAFKRYLQQIQRYTNVQEASDRFQKYLPYAVAMGVDQEFTRQFQSVPAAMPTWYIPYGYGPFIPYGTYGQAGTGGQAVGGGVQGPGGGFDPGGAMQSMSDSMAGAMQGLSDSFTSMVNSASSAFTSQPSSSGSGGGGGGGGWGGGGGGFGGGGGGGGGGGAD